jgi:hypothetical protein
LVAALIAANNLSVILDRRGIRPEYQNSDPKIAMRRLDRQAAAYGVETRSAAYLPRLRHNRSPVLRRTFETAAYDDLGETRVSVMGIPMNSCLSEENYMDTEPVPVSRPDGTPVSSDAARDPVPLIFEQIPHH